ncbi:TlpA family protein disulfide reductase [Pseudoalteromonas sp. SMS1]|uniref:TlpA disulfide reductase family protein n=1 Tax=Pseudoalteromonas sp. SMS1 TaxID=2908894 RepID=UPI001F1F74D3|nr:TlpA disulfide reductase family protein [Pseudoalteromonas sp. SMS1]MCF2860273.1 TlpA family protein disulfide reductase [Pseudoalteromonas sp. SMS1]
MKIPLLLLCLFSISIHAKQYAPLQTQTLDSKRIFTQGKVTYLKFWATWCAYCVEEMPKLQQSHEYAQGAYQVISVNIGFNQTLEGVKRYLGKHNYNFPTVFDSDGTITRQYAVLGTPQHILIDAQGKEIYRSGLFTDQLAQKLAHLRGLK